VNSALIANGLAQPAIVQAVRSAEYMRRMIHVDCCLTAVKNNRRLRPTQCNCSIHNSAGESMVRKRDDAGQPTPWKLLWLFRCSVKEQTMALPCKL
jgi:hypothetical protein